MADPNRVPAAFAGALAGVLTGARTATLAGVDRRGAAGVVLVGHKCVAVLVVLVVVGGIATVVGGAGIVVDVAGAAGAERRWGAAPGCVALESATWV